MSGNRLSISSSHPIVFVLDFANDDAEIPEYSVDSLVASNDSCVSIRVMSDVDGEVEVGLGGSLPKDERLQEVFRGVVAAPSRKIAVVSSENEVLVETPVAGGAASVVIRVDDEEHPSKVLVEVG